MSWLSVFISSCTDLFSSPVKRSDAEQQRVDRIANELTLYVVNSCSLCAKLRRHIQLLNVSVSIKDLKRCHVYEKELLAGGKAQVPCLRLDKGGKVHWLYKYEEIVHYLDKKFAPRPQSDKIEQAQ
jgi:glutaredoxin